MTVVLEDKVRATVLGNPDGLNDADLRHIRRRSKKLVRNLRRKYEFLGKAMGETHIVEHRPNLEERRLTIFFKRCVNNDKLETEAVIDVNIQLLKPRTKKELKALGLTRDPEVPERVLSLNGEASRPCVRNTLAINDLRISKIPTSGAVIFNTLVEHGFLKHPGVQNYIPLLDSDEPLTPLGRSERRAEAKRPLQKLDKEQRDYITRNFKNVRKNFKERYGHIFDEISYDYDMAARSFTLSLTASKAFAGKGAHSFTLQGDFDLIWRNDGGSGTHIDLSIKGGLSREFQQALALTSPIRIEDKYRAQASDRLFEILALSGKISVTDVKSAREAAKDRRMQKPTRAERAKGHRSQRTLARMAAQRAIANGYKPS